MRAVLHFPFMSSRPSLFDHHYRALVFGASGGIGKALANQLRDDAHCSEVIGLSRSSPIRFDLEDEASIAKAAAACSGPIDLMIDATGFLSGGGIMPEKSLNTITSEAMARLFALNATGPALLLKHFHPLLPRDRRAVFATLSARVGSIGDNRLGGWHAYRASKAALNMIVRGAAIEIARRNPESLVIALHPGTVATRLSDPFAGKADRLSPEQAALRLLTVIAGLPVSATGGFFAHDGAEIPW